MISDKEQQLANLTINLPVNVRDILSKWFTANNKLREDPRNTIEADFGRQEVLDYAKKNPGVIDDIRALCVELENEIHPTQNLSDDDIVIKEPNKKPKNKKLKNGKPKKPLNKLSDLINPPDLSNPTIQKLSSEKSSLSGMFIEVDVQDAIKATKIQAEALKEKLQGIIKGLVKEKILSEESGVGKKFFDLQISMIKSSTELSTPQYYSALQDIDSLLTSQNEQADKFINEFKRNVEACSQLNILEDIHHEIEELKTPYALVKTNFGGLRYKPKFEELNNEMVDIQKEKQADIKEKYKKYESFKDKGINLVDEFFATNSIDFDDSENLKLLNEKFESLKCMAGLEKLESDLKIQNTKAIAEINEYIKKFNTEFPSKYDRDLLDEYCRDSRKLGANFKQLCEDYTKASEAKELYSALRYLDSFKKVLNESLTKKNQVGYQPFKDQNALQALNKQAAELNAQSPSIFTRIKQKFKSFYEDHPYISWALIGAGIGLGVFVGGAIAVGVTIATGGTAGAVLAGALVGLLALKVTGGAVVSAGTGAAVAVSVKKCSTARIHQDLDSTVKQGYAHQSLPLPEVESKPIAPPENRHLDLNSESRELTAMKRRNWRLI